MATNPDRDTAEAPAKDSGVGVFWYSCLTDPDLGTVALGGLHGGELMVKAYADLASLPEDDRIALIGEAARQNIVGVCLEKNDPAKIARYIQKVTDRYPDVKLLDQFDGPTYLVKTLRFGPKPN